MEIRMIGATILVKWVMLFSSLAPKILNKRPIKIVLIPCATAQVKVTLVTSVIVHCSFLPMAITGSK